MATLGKMMSPAELRTAATATALVLVLILGDVVDTPNLDGECVIAGDCVWNDDGTTDGEDCQAAEGLVPIEKVPPGSRSN